MKSIEERIKDLPPELRKQIHDFVESLCRKQQQARSKPTFSWAGALQDLRDSFTSVELQHKVSGWRIGEK
jgi:uncharacterized caspase-like protein